MLVFTNDTNIVDDVLVHDGIPGSDHDAVQFTLHIDPRPSQRNKSRRVYNFQKADFEKFRDHLCLVPWECCFIGKGVEEAWTDFKDVLFTIVDECIPTFHLNQKRKKTWLSDETMKLIKKKRRVYKQARRTGSQSCIRKYKDLCNSVRSLTRRDQRHHLDEITQHLATNQKPFWSWLKNIKGAHPPIPDLHYLRSTLSKPFEKARCFNDYFASVFTKENTSEIRANLRSTRNPAQMDDPTFAEEDVFNILCSLNPNKPCGPDNIPGRLLKEGAAWIKR